MKHWASVGLELVCGQGISLIIAGGGFMNNKLGATGMNVPIGQNVLFYGILALFLIPFVILNKSIVPKCAAWKYFLIGVLDVQANAMSAYAYQHASLTVITLLQLLSLPAAMVASMFMHLARYNVRHYIFIALALVGMIACVLIDTLDTSSPQNNEVLGIILGAVSPILFGILNALGERFVNSGGFLEYVSFFGAFALLTCGVETLAAEFSRWSVPDGWTWFETEALVALGYILTPLYLKFVPVTILNMSLLTIGAFGMILDCLVLGSPFSWPDLVCEVWSIIFTALYAVWPPLRGRFYTEKEPLLETPKEPLSSPTGSDMGAVSVA